MTLHILTKNVALNSDIQVPMEFRCSATLILTSLTEVLYKSLKQVVRGCGDPDVQTVLSTTPDDITQNIKITRRRKFAGVTWKFKSAVRRTTLATLAISHRADTALDTDWRETW